MGVSLPSVSGTIVNIYPIIRVFLGQEYGQGVEGRENEFMDIIRAKCGAVLSLLVLNAEVWEVNSLFSFKGEESEELNSNALIIPKFICDSIMQVCAHVDDSTIKVPTEEDENLEAFQFTFAPASFVVHRDVTDTRKILVSIYRPSSIIESVRDQTSEIVAALDTVQSSTDLLSTLAASMAILSVYPSTFSMLVDQDIIGTLDK